MSNCVIILPVILARKDHMKNQQVMDSSPASTNGFFLPKNLEGFVAMAIHVVIDYQILLGGDVPEEFLSRLSFTILVIQRYPRCQLVEVNAHSLFSKWFSESGKLLQEMVEEDNILVFVLIDEVESLAAARTAHGFIWL
ncbi:ATPase, AAA-type, core [Dillenia turbinata]|uniref:Pachytene checkpoint protein 2 homolog n=1 Tax=Dillenia turbinata TaxID=194707 RepID=A0AAN8UZM9_9MAGN